MELLRRVIINFPQLPKCRIPSQAVFFNLNLQRLPVSSCQVHKNFGSSPTHFKDEELPSSLFKYEVFPDKTAPAVLDVEEERRKISNETLWDEFEGISLKRGITGVFDVEEVVELLKREKAKDIFVVKIPPEYNYADYKVIVTGRSQRHMFAMAAFLRKLYKKRVQSDRIPHLEGKNSKTWMALDLGNIILHVFSDQARSLYDLETLWSVGKDYDTLSNQKDIYDDFSDYAKILADLNPKT